MLFKFLSKHKKGFSKILVLTVKLVFLNEARRLAGSLLYGTRKPVRQSGSDVSDLGEVTDAYYTIALALKGDIDEQLVRRLDPDLALEALKRFDDATFQALGVPADSELRQVSLGLRQGKTWSQVREGQRGDEVQGQEDNIANGRTEPNEVQ